LAENVRQGVGTKLAKFTWYPILNSSVRRFFNMSQNRSGNEGITGNTGTGTPGATGGSQGTTGQGNYGGSQTGTGGTGTATALSQTAQDYGQRISEVATQAKD
jgi:hypothetical protein